MTTAIDNQRHPAQNTRRPATLTRGQRLHLVLMQVLFLVLGLFFMVMGSLRVLLTVYGGDAVRDVAGQTLGADLITTPTLILGGVVALVGYGLVWATAALGAKEPPAWHAGRAGLVGVLAVLGPSAVFLVVQSVAYRWPLLGATVLVSALAAYLLTQFGQVDYRLALGAERLRKQEVRIFTFRNIGLVLVASLLTVLGLVYAVLSDAIELPLPDTTPGELLYITDFENYNDEWDLFAGRDTADIVTDETDNTRLVITVNSGVRGAGVFSALNRKFRDLDVRVTTEQLASPSDYINRYGVIFRYRDNAHYYGFELSGDGYYRFYKVRPSTEEERRLGRGETITEEISTWIGTTNDDGAGPPYPTIIRPGTDNPINAPLDATNEIRVVARGNRFWFFVNGQHLRLCPKGDSRFSTYTGGRCHSSEMVDFYEDTDTPYHQGKIALLVAVGNSNSEDATAPVSVAFDNILIVGPDVPTLDTVESFPAPTPTP